MSQWVTTHFFESFNISHGFRHPLILPLQRHSSLKPMLMKTQNLSPQRAARLQDLISLANHPDREQWQGLRCHLIPRGRFTATYSELALRWGVSASVAYSTIKALVKLGYITTERLDFSTLITIVSEPNAQAHEEMSAELQPADGNGSATITPAKKPEAHQAPKPPSPVISKHIRKRRLKHKRRLRRRHR